MRDHSVFFYCRECSIKVRGAAAAEKNEMVYSTACPDGNVYSTTVETTLVVDNTEEYVLDTAA